MHSKNNNALMNYKNINFYIINNITNLNEIDLSKFDVVYSPCEPINVNEYPNTKFIFGPHFSVFPEKHHMDIIRRKNVIYVQPSEWAAEVWKISPLCNNIKIQSLPFGVDTEKFNNNKSISEREKVFIYFKTRHPQLLYILQSFLNDKNISYEIFNYNTRYDENTYIEYLKEAKYGIWLGRHESQGFALEEALSCNVPLLVWNVKSMNEEYGYNYSDIPASVIPYWDERCGEYFYNVNELENIFNTFISKLETYKPREYILENLTMEVCEQKLIQLIENI
jgi:glycosyltransferase involved in cell wall biosynthesis